MEVFCMAPPAKVNRELIIEVGLNLIREEGIDSLNVRKIATELKCSTRPILYYYKTMDELKKAVYDKADEYHCLSDCGIYILHRKKKICFVFCFNQTAFRMAVFGNCLQTAIIP